MTLRNKKVGSRPLPSSDKRQQKQDSTSRGKIQGTPSADDAMVEFLEMSGYCSVAPGHPFHGPYHDAEYGFPSRSETVLFERLTLEINQAGLSWLTILKKRQAFQAAFHGFAVDRVAHFGARDRTRLLRDAGIIRNRLKIESAVSNAGAFLDVQEEFGSFSKYQWGFVDGVPVRNKWDDIRQLPARTPLSDAFSKDLKKRGFTFVGSTIIYAHMQAVGMVNDHLTGCFRYRQVQKN